MNSKIITFVVLSLHMLVVLAGLSLPVIMAMGSFWSDGELTFSAYRALPEQVGRWRELLEHTLAVTVTALFIAIVCGTGLATTTFKTCSWRGARWLLLLCLMIACTPLYVTTTALLAIPGMTTCQGSWLAAGIVHGLAYIPLATLLIGLGLRAVEPEIEEAGLLDLSPCGVLWHITLPRAAWSICATALLLAVLVMTDYSVTDILGVRTFSEEVYTQYQLKGNRVAPILLSLPVMLILVVTFAVTSRTIRQSAQPFFQGQVGQSMRIPLKRLGKAVGYSLLMIVTGIGIVLLVRLIQQSQGLSRIASAMRSFRLEWQTTLFVSFVTGLLVAILSVGLAGVLARGRTSKKLTGLMVITLLSIPAPSLAMTLISLFNAPPPPWLSSSLTAIGLPGDPLGMIYENSAIYIIGYTLRFLPFGILLVLPSIQRIPSAFEEAMRCEGGNWLAIWGELHWPAARRSALLAGLVVMIFSFGELDIASLLQVPACPMLSIRFFSFIHYGLSADVGAVCIASTITMIPLVLILYFSISTNGRDRAQPLHTL